MQVYNCRPRGAILVVAQPQQLLGILHELFNRPALLVRLDERCRRELRCISHQAEDLPGLAFAGEDDMQEPKAADLEPPGIDIAVAGLTMGLHAHQGFCAAPPKEITPIAAGFELPAQLAEAAVALERGGEVKAPRPTGLDNGMAQLVGIKQDEDFHAGRRLELLDQLGG
jgi:hypothetical protein